MYRYHNIPDLIKTTEAIIEKPIELHGIGIYVDCNPDDVAPDIYIDPLDTKGIEIFREFAARMAAHYKSLNNKS